MLETEFNSPGLPPYTMMETDDGEPDFVGSFFDSASEYYKQKPWKLLEDETPLKIDVSDRQQTDNILGYRNGSGPADVRAVFI